jgi:hypothetical protein
MDAPEMGGRESAENTGIVVRASAVITAAVAMRRAL